MRKFELASKFKSGWSLVQILDELKKEGSQKNVEGMKKFGISTQTALGITIPKLRYLGYRVGKNHALAQEIWNSGIHEARILAAFIDIPIEVDEGQMESWVKDFNSWDLCDQVCGNLFDKTKLAWKKTEEWSEREEEFVKRAGFVLMATLAVHDRQAKDDQFESFFPILEKHAHDERNFVKKAINWALRQIGKRNLNLHKQAIACAERMMKQNSKSAQWIGHDALRELKSDSVLNRFNPKKEMTKPKQPLSPPTKSERVIRNEVHAKKWESRKISNRAPRTFTVKKN